MAGRLSSTSTCLAVHLSQSSLLPTVRLMIYWPWKRMQRHSRIFQSSPNFWIPWMLNVVVVTRKERIPIRRPSLMPHHQRPLWLQRMTTLLLFLRLLLPHQLPQLPVSTDVQSAMVRRNAPSLHLTNHCFNCSSVLPIGASLHVRVTIETFNHYPNMLSVMGF